VYGQARCRGQHGVQIEMCGCESGEGNEVVDDTRSNVLLLIAGAGAGAQIDVHLQSEENGMPSSFLPYPK
jgi:hypothetical protein